MTKLTEHQRNLKKLNEQQQHRKDETNRTPAKTNETIANDNDMEIVLSKNQRRKLRKNQNKTPTGRKQKPGPHQLAADKTNAQTTKDEDFKFVESATDIDTGKKEIVFHNFVEGTSQGTIKNFLKIRGVKWERIDFFVEEYKGRRAALVKLGSDREAIEHCFLCYDRSYKHMDKDIRAHTSFGISNSRTIERIYNLL